MKKRLFIIILLSFVFIGLSIYKEFFNTKILYVGNNTQFIIKNNRIIRKTGTLKKNISKAKILLDNDFINGYMAVDNSEYGMSIQMYNESKERVVSSNAPMVYTGNIDIVIPTENKITKYNKRDEEVIKEKMKTNDIEGEITSYSKYLIDIDNDDEMEELYSLLIKSNKEVISFIFMDENVLLKQAEDIEKGPFINRYRVFKIIDIFNDNSYEILVANSTGDDMPTYYDIYKYEDDSFIKVGDR